VLLCLEPGTLPKPLLAHNFRLYVGSINAASRGVTPLAPRPGRNAAQQLGALPRFPLLNARVAFASAGLDQRLEVARAIIYGDLFSDADFFWAEISILPSVWLQRRSACRNGSDTWRGSFGSIHRLSSDDRAQTNIATSAVRRIS
jgi:hypothetical protein